MASYYYLISSLPMLKTQGEPPMDYAAFLAMCKSAVSSGVYQTLEELTALVRRMQQQHRQTRGRCCRSGPGFTRPCAGS